MQAEKYSIKEWAKDDRPREKLLLKGPQSLSDSELLAILIQNGTHERSALDLAREVLKLGKDSLPELGKLNIKELMRVKGIGEAKAITLVAAMEIGRRRQALSVLEKPVVSSSTDVALYLQSLLRDHKHEVFAVLFLNRANKINHFEVFYGAIGGFVAVYIFDQRFHETLGMLRGKNDPGFHLAFGRAGHHVHEINHKFSMRMGDDGQVRIGSFCHFFCNFYIDLVLRLLVHKLRFQAG